MYPIKLVALLGILTGCSVLEPYRNSPRQGDQSHEYDLVQLQPAVGNSDEVLVLVTISGGGARAAAFALGALQAMDQLPIGAGTMYSEIDYVSGASGGSFVAAFVAMNPASALADFEDVVLRAGLERTVVNRTLFSPRDGMRLSSPWYARGDLFGEVVDQRVFNGLTFGELRRRGTRPYLAIHATDLVTGKRFEFSSATFAQVCSNLDGFPVARAVAASSAVPVVLSPIAVLDYGPCEARRKTPLVRHLIDGGLSDNLALGGLLGSQRDTEDIDALRRYSLIVVVSLDAQRGPLDNNDHSLRTPTISESVAHLSGHVVRARSNKLAGDMRRLVRRTQARLGEGHTQLCFLEISLDRIAAAQQPELMLIPITLDLETAQIAALRSAGRQAFLQSQQKCKGLSR